jgi:hypothetical protein
MKLTDEKTNHIMVDIETMGLLSDSAICSIGAICFNVRDGITGDGFYRECLSLNEQVIQYKRVIYPDTMRFWAQQDSEIQRCFARDRLGSYKEIMTDFHTWMQVSGSGLGNAYVWCKSPQLDIAILEDIFFKLGLDMPWSYKNIVDLRSLSALIPHGVTYAGVKHNALDDAKNQALQAIDLMRRFQQTCDLATTFVASHGSFSDDALPVYEITTSK